jgi:hypothetical protein
VSGAPHSAQNLARGSVSAPHRGQRGVKEVPHSMQNLAPSGVSVSQRGQRIARLSDAVVQAVGARTGTSPSACPSSRCLGWCVSTPDLAPCQAKSTKGLRALRWRGVEVRPERSRPVWSRESATTLSPSGFRSAA